MDSLMRFLLFLLVAGALLCCGAKAAVFGPLDLPASRPPSKGDVMKTILPAFVIILLSHPAAALPRYVGVELVRSEPQGAGPIPAIFAWLESSLLGNAAAALAVVAMAMAGLMMLTRRSDMRLDGLEKLSEQPAGRRGAAAQPPSRDA